MMYFEGCQNHLAEEIYSEISQAVAIRRTKYPNYSDTILISDL